MKKLLLFLLLYWTSNSLLRGQTMPGVTGQICENCVPPGYTLISGSARIESVGGVGGKFSNHWSPDFDNYWDTPTGGPEFLALLFSESVTTAVSTTISNLVPGKFYVFSYGVIPLEAGEYSEAPKETFIEISEGGTGSCTSNLQSNDVGYWQSGQLIFQATDETAVIIISGKGSGTGGFLGFDIDSQGGHVREANAEQVELYVANLVIDCNNPNGYLGESMFPYKSKGEVRFYKNPYHTGDYSTSLYFSEPGTYYAFAVDKSSGVPLIEIFNTDYSTSVLTVIENTPNGGKQVALQTSALNIACSSGIADLSKALGQAIPQNNELVWYNTPTREGQPVQNPGDLPEGDYYAFFYNAQSDCYNTDLSTAKAAITKGEQVEISKTSLGNFCPANSVSLGLAFKASIPQNSNLFWYTTPNHADGTLVPNASSVTTGTYYAFFYDFLNNCFNTDASTAQVSVTIAACDACKAGTSQVSLNKAVLDNSCPQIYVNLNSALDGAVPPGASLVWYSNNNHSGAPIKNPASVVQSGDYYAFFYVSDQDCFNTNQSTAHVTVTINSCETACHGGLPQVQLTGSKLGILCPATTGNLNSKFTSVPPQGFSLVWFTTDTPIGSPLSHPNVVGPGTYYAFFYNPKGDCYNVDKSTSLVTVASQGPCETQLNVKVFLQGAMAGAEMRNDLQSAGLLPVNDPYNGSSTFASINNVALAGKVVDWIQVEVRKSESPFDVLEAKSLLLKTDGTIVQPDGLPAKFGQLTGDFRIAVRHRNHLLVVSNVIDENNSPAYSYDFSAAQDLAYRPDGLYQPQLTLANGKWSLWAGDCDADGGIDISDHNRVKVANSNSLVNVYHAADVNLDGKVDAADLALVHSSNAKAAFSILGEN